MARRSSLNCSSVSVEQCVARLMRMLAALEETVIRLEHHGGGDSTDTIRRLRVVQGEILAAVRLLQGDFPDSG